MSLLVVEVALEAAVLVCIVAVVVNDVAFEGLVAVACNNSDKAVAPAYVERSSGSVVGGDERRLDRSFDEASEAMPGSVVAVEEVAVGSTIL